jgi:hypothetical protein
MTHVLQVLFLSVFILQLVMHGEESQVPGDLSQHRYDAKDPKYRILYNHFNQPSHDRCLTMKVRIIEKISHLTNSPMLRAPYRADRDLLLIEMIIQNPVFGIFCIISMLAHPTSQCLTSFTNIQKSTECTFYAVNDIFSRKV